MADGRFALIVANSRYSDATLTQLEAPAHDAASLAAALGAPAIGGFEVTTVLDQPAPHVMQEVEAFFDGRRRDDLVLLYFSGHGILDESARLYFATAETRVDRPRSTAVAAGFVNDVMSECRSRRQVLLLDCCNSGAFARGIKAGGNIGTGGRFEGRGRVVITASDALQYAFEGERIEGQAIRSVFTDVLVDGLNTGAADLDGDGYITLDELYEYAYGRVVDTSPRQRPRKWAFGVEGQLLIARAAGEGADAGPLPRSMQEPARPSVGRSDRTPRRLWSGRRPALLAAAVAIVAAGAIAAAAVLLNGTAKSPSLEAGRNATLAVFEAWQAQELDSLDASLISAGARRTLTEMPIEPIAPNPPAPDDCYGSPDEVECTYDYPGQGIYLSFGALKYPAGMRVAYVLCRESSTGNEPDDGIAACAEIVRTS